MRLSDCYKKMAFNHHVMSFQSKQSLFKINKIGEFQSLEIILIPAGNWWVKYVRININIVEDGLYGDGQKIFSITCQLNLMGLRETL